MHIDKIFLSFSSILSFILAHKHLNNKVLNILKNYNFMYEWILNIFELSELY